MPPPSPPSRLARWLRGLRVLVGWLDHEAQQRIRQAVLFSFITTVALTGVTLGYLWVAEQEDFWNHSWWFFGILAGAVFLLMLHAAYSGLSSPTGTFRAKFQQAQNRLEAHELALDQQQLLSQQLSSGRTPHKRVRI